MKYHLIIDITPGELIALGFSIMSGYENAKSRGDGGMEALIGSLSDKIMAAEKPVVEDPDDKKKGQAGQA